MNNIRNILSVLCVLAFFAIGQSAYAAPKVEPRVISGASDKLGLTYNELDPDTTYTVKRSVVRGGTPSGDWEIVGSAGKLGALPPQDTGLKPEVQYAYALFDERGETKIQSFWYSQVPNNQIATLESEERGAIRSGNPGTEPPSAAPPPGGTPPPSSGVTDPTVTTLLVRARGVLDALIPFIIGLAVFVIIWGIFSYITHAAEEEKRAEAKRFIIYGLLGVFFMISIWGFVTILINTFSVEQRIQSGDIPTVPEIVPTSE